MKSKQTMFFALLDDIKPILAKVESAFQINYFKTGMYAEKTIPYYQSFLDIPDLGFSISGDWNRVDNYLVIPKNTKLNIRDVPQRKGGIMYAIDQMTNKNSISFKAGGIYIKTEKILVAGQIGTISNSVFSLDIFNYFSTQIKKEFRRIGTFYVGKQSEEKLKDGWRLVTNDRSPKEYDLTF